MRSSSDTWAEPTARASLLQRPNGRAEAVLREERDEDPEPARRSRPRRAHRHRRSGRLGRKARRRSRYESLPRPPDRRPAAPEPRQPAAARHTSASRTASRTPAAAPGRCAPSTARGRRRRRRRSRRSATPAPITSAASSRSRSTACYNDRRRVARRRPSSSTRRTTTGTPPTSRSSRCARAARPGPSSAATRSRPAFCLIDLVKIDGNAPAGESIFFDCDTSYQGISAGWVDQYHQSTDGQQVDLTGAAERERLLPRQHGRTRPARSSRSRTRRTTPRG